MIAYGFICYHRLVVETELWRGGSRISFLCVLLNDGIHTCNKHTVVTQEIRELPCNNVTFYVDTLAIELIVSISRIYHKNH